MANWTGALDWERLNDRFGGYRPALDRTLFGLALLGVVIVVHLGLQQARGFEQGCFGIAALDAAAPGFDCGAVLASGASTLLGISNVVWGVFFYVVVAALSFAALVVPTWRLQAKQARAGFIGAGFLYSAYLVYYQITQLDALCALCLVSAGIVTVLFVLLVGSLLFTNRSSHPMSLRSSKREFTLLTYLLALAGLLIAADAVYVGSRSATAASSPAPAAVASAVPDTTQVAEGCYYDPEKEPVENFSALVDFQDPSKGSAQSPVTIVEYFDPNCPHCKTMHAVMKKVIEQYGDEAQFVFKPMPLWGYSVPQIEALYAAAQEGKFFEMLDAQYARQQRGGLSMEQMQGIAREIGMNPDVLASRIQQQTHRDRIMQQRKRAVEIGVDSTPTIIINGRFIAGQSRTPRCFGAFIDAARQQASADTSG